MSPEDRTKLIEIAGSIAVFLLEWYAIQPHHSPILAVLWNWLARLYRSLASTFGMLALNAECNYYLAVSSNGS